MKCWFLRTTENEHVRISDLESNSNDCLAQSSPFYPLLPSTMTLTDWYNLMNTFGDRTLTITQNGPFEVPRLWLICLLWAKSVPPLAPRAFGDHNSPFMWRPCTLLKSPLPRCHTKSQVFAPWRTITQILTKARRIGFPKLLPRSRTPLVVF